MVEKGTRWLLRSLIIDIEDTCKIYLDKTLASQDDLISYVLPLFVRAYDDSVPRIQEEVLRRTVPFARQLNMQLVNQAMVLRVHGLALKTTVAAMRVNALHCLGELVSALDKLAILDILLALQHCTAIDHSTPTLMCTLGVANSIYKQHGTEFAIEHVLSLLFPLRTAQQLNVQQFTYKIEEKRGATMSDSGASQVKVSSALANELRSEPLPKSSAQNSLTKSRPSCDDDWGPTVKKTTNASLPTEFSHQPEQSFPILQSVPDPAIPLQSLMAVPTHQTSMACTPVDIEWPPSNSYSGFGAQLSVNEKQNPAAIFNSAFDDLDPFANWPPKPSNSASNLASVTVPTQSHDISGSGMSSIESSTGQSKPQ